jgi:hypothetical protein
MEFTSVKASLDSVSDVKKKIEITSQFKKARARFQVVEQMKKA